MASPERMAEAMTEVPRRLEVAGACQSWTAGLGGALRTAGTSVREALRTRVATALAASRL